MHARPLVFAAAILAMSSATAGARDLTLAVGSPGQTAVRQVFAKPFTDATAIPTSVIAWSGDMDMLRGQAKAPDNTWDMVLVNSEDLATGCSENLFEKLDWSAIGGKDHYLPQAVSDCGVGATVASLALAWDRGQIRHAADVGGLLGCNEVPWQARAAQGRAWQPGIRADRRRCGAGRCVQGAGDVRRR